MKDQTPRYFRVSPKFWTDPAVEKWSDEAKLLALYILTCQQRTTEGLFPFRVEYAQIDLGWTSEQFGKPFGELLETGFVNYDPDARVLLITNALRYQAPQNENQAKNAVKRLRNLPETPLACTFRTLCRTLSQWLEDALANELPEFGEPSRNLSSSIAHNSVAQPRSSTSISETQSPSLSQSRSPKSENSSQTVSNGSRPTVDELAGRMVAVCEAKDIWLARKVAMTAMAAVDAVVVDELIGFAAKAKDKPRDPRYFLTALRQWAIDRGIPDPGEMKLVEA